MDMHETPFVRGRWLLGNGPDILRRPLELLTEVAQHGDVVRFQLPAMPAVLVNHPELVRRVLLDSKSYNKDMRSYARMRALVGTGLATSDGDLWLRQRRIAQPAFHRQKIAGFGELMLRFATATRDAWVGQNGRPIDVVADMTRLTLGVVCEALFGGDDPEDSAVFARSFHHVLGYFVDRLNRLWYLPLSVPTPDNLRCRRALAELDGAVYRMIARRRALLGEQGESTDLLGRMMQARDVETGEAMSDAQLRDEVITMLLGGHETTAMTLSWAIALLARHPAIQDRLRAELAASVEPEELPYLRMVVDETLRLYPPIWLIARNAARDQELGGHHIAARTAVFMSPYVMHRTPAFWEAPTAFWPDRFAAETNAHAFIPFISGPRQCIGNNFALLEARLVLAVLAKRFRFELAPNSVVEPEPILTLRPREGLRILAHPI